MKPTLALVLEVVEVILQTEEVAEVEIKDTLQADPVVMDSAGVVKEATVVILPVEEEMVNHHNFDLKNVIKYIKICKICYLF